MPSSDLPSRVHSGGCRCKRITYRLTGPPMFINCCHCRDCQTLSGSAFGINAMIETSRVEITSDAQPDKNSSGMILCAECGTNLWGGVEQFGDGVLFVRVGTLDDAHDVCWTPDAFFFVRSKHAWVTLLEGAKWSKTMPGEDEQSLWNEETKKRLSAATARKI